MSVFPRNFTEKLSQAHYYEQAIERLHRKFASTSPRKLFEEGEGGFSFAQAYNDKAKLAKLLARDVSAGAYRFAPAHINKMHVGGKMREIYGFTLFDRIVHMALYDMLSEDMQQRFSSHVYSYTKGKDRTDAVFGFLEYIRKHKKRYALPTSRGVCVYRFDIKSYGESIPVHPASPLWPLLARIFTDAYGAPPSAYERELLEALIRPMIETKEGALFQNQVGIPDGAPITSILLNLYVSQLDQFLSSIPGAFYARYGDDIIFAHEQEETFTRSVARLGEILQSLGLSQNVKKTKAVFFNAAGRSKGVFKGTTKIEYLGMEMDFSGTASLKNEKIQLLMRDLTQRAGKAVKSARGKELEEQGRIVCSVINNILNPSHPLSNPYAVFLRRSVNNRGQLNDLDYRIARLVLQTLTNDASVKKFRAIPYKKLREEWNLVSLEYARNQVDRVE